MYAFARKLFKFLSSLKLAVLIILSLAAALATGTVFESLYDTRTANFYIYRSLWFALLLTALGINILCVALSRLPWKKRHIPFLLAHLGILILLLGSYLTQKLGIDANMVMSEGQTTAVVEEADTILVIRPADQQMAQKFQIHWVPPQENYKPMPIPEYGLNVRTFITHAEPIFTFSQKKTATARKEPALKLFLKIPRMGVKKDFWLWTGDPAWKQLSLGPAAFHLVGEEEWKILNSQNYTPQGTQLFFIWSEKNGRPALQYVAYSRTGKVKKGSVDLRSLPRAKVETGWGEAMGGIDIEIQEIVSDATNSTHYVPARTQYGQNAPPSAIEIESSDGRSVWLGQDDRVAFKTPQQELMLAYMGKRIVLPFALGLDRFKIEYDAGTQNPSSYSSLVRVLAKEAPAEPILISMNEPLDWGRYTFYQASFIPDEPRPVTTVLSVNYDPGRWYKYIGSLLIVLGSAMLFVVKYRQSKKRLSTASATVALAFALFAPIFSFADNQPPSNIPNDSYHQAMLDPPTEIHPRVTWSFNEFESTPILSGGRLKPLDTYAKEIVLYITGARSYKNWKNADLLLSWVTATRYWYDQPIVKVAHQDTRKQLLLDLDRTHFTPRELFQNPTVAQYVQAEGVQAQAPDDKKLPAREQDLKRVLQGVILFDRLVRGYAWPIVPTPPPQEWEPFIGSNEKSSNPIRGQFAEVVRSYYANNREAFHLATTKLKTEIENQIQGWSASSERSIQAEVHYNRLRPFQIAWVLYLISAMTWMLSMLFESKSTASPAKSLFFKRVGFSSLAAALLMHAYGVGLRVFIAGRPPVTNMYETVIWVAFGVILFGSIVYYLHRQKVVYAVACLLASFILIVSDSAPAVLDPSIHPLVPVLRSNFWLLIHVLTITISYAAFALALGIGNVALFQYIRGHKAPERKAKIELLNQLSYRAVQFGVVLVAAGTILGGVWADYSWGRFWGWDPKEVWALIVLLIYVAILHGRMTGWVGQFGFSALNVIAFLSVIMAWYGVNFVLGVGLHSYGFSTGGTPFVIGFCLLQLSYVGFAALRFRKA